MRLFLTPSMMRLPNLEAECDDGEDDGVCLLKSNGVNASTPWSLRKEVCKIIITAIVADKQVRLNGNIFYDKAFSCRMNLVLSNKNLGYDQTGIGSFPVVVIVDKRSVPYCFMR